MDGPPQASLHPLPSVLTTDSEPSSLPVKRLLRHSDLDNLETLQNRYARTRPSFEQTNAMMDNIMSINTSRTSRDLPSSTEHEPQSPRRSFTSPKKWPLQDGRLQVQSPSNCIVSYCYILNVVFSDYHHDSPIECPYSSALH
jgi:hypothetical protein